MPAVFGTRNGYLILKKILKNIRETVSIPLLIMGYFNPMYQYGIEAFCNKCNEIGIDGLIIPDLPLKEFEEQYKSVFKANNLKNVFLCVSAPLR